MTAYDPADGGAEIAVIGLAARFGPAADVEAFREQPRTAAGPDLALADPYDFDNTFFGISPREAVIMDPQQRLLMECAYHALEDAGVRTGAQDGVVGIYAGGGTTGHAARLRARADRLVHVDDREIRAATGADFLASRAAYKLGLTGPAVSVQAAGATTPVAVHTAVQGLLGGECDLALAGAVTVLVAEDGTATGGCGIVVLKPLAAALADGDRIHAVVRATAVGTAGRGEAPAAARDRIARDARAVGGVDAGAVLVVGPPAAGANPTDTAPATAAFIQNVLAVQDGGLPGGAGAWPAGDGPRRVGLSAAGPFGGHAHVIVEQAPAGPEPEPEGADRRPAAAGEGWQLLPFSARSAAGLDGLAARLGEHLEHPGPAELPDTAWTLQTGRTSYPHRRYVVARTAAEAVEELATAKAPGRAARRASGEAPPVVFTFPGNGGQHLGMARELYRVDARFRADIDACSRHVLAEQGLDPRRLVDPAADDEEQVRRELALGIIAQTGVFVVEYALARAFARWGVRPSAVVGHSLGAYAAACVAGVFSFPDAVELVGKRTELLAGLKPGAMAAVRLPEADLIPLLPDGVGIAAISGPDQVSVSGPRDLVERFVEEAAAAGHEVRLLRIPGAGHSSLVDPVLDEFEAFVAGVELHEPSVPVVSDTTGTWADPGAITTPGYWREHMRRTVRYHDVLDTLAGIPHAVLLECGPGTSLSSLARRHPRLREEHEILQALPHPTDPTSDVRILLAALGGLWTAGVDVAWPELHAPHTPRKTTVPGHPFRRTAFPVPAN
ncbi:acyltransferase domain-containing protein [Kitasatospora sp. NPDC094011]|uniref:acyltransferase domain-containing protein n=1 Tax=Kitasatospora sp. NPDC094011 TaxID=3364090 RepID=UPI0037F8A58D